MTRPWRAEIPAETERNGYLNGEVVDTFLGGGGGVGDPGPPPAQPWRCDGDPCPRCRASRDTHEGGGSGSRGQPRGGGSADSSWAEASELGGRHVARVGRWMPRVASGSDNERDGEAAVGGESIGGCLVADWFAAILAGDGEADT